MMNCLRLPTNPNAKEEFMMADFRKVGHKEMPKILSPTKKSRIKNSSRERRMSKK